MSPDMPREVLSTRGQRLVFTFMGSSWMGQGSRMGSCVTHPPRPSLSCCLSSTSMPRTDLWTQQASMSAPCTGQQCAQTSTSSSLSSCPPVNPRASGSCEEQPCCAVPRDVCWCECECYWLFGCWGSVSVLVSVLGGGVGGCGVVVSSWASSISTSTMSPTFTTRRTPTLSTLGAEGMGLASTPCTCWSRTLPNKARAPRTPTSLAKALTTTKSGPESPIPCSLKTFPTSPTPKRRCPNPCCVCPDGLMTLSGFLAASPRRSGMWRKIVKSPESVSPDAAKAAAWDS
eukprot:gnl/Chilomastix_caulleri/1138.p1 GENE.gnl/Chilomastix_caulleri/1138~~gnl/Chilomastix_caulleri/1138.p1  ORF type:complete len:287 (+),score=79.23 gnl/Chilomastix_caulleri/1138:288-1148(+)